MKRTITLRYLFTLCVMTLVSAFWGGNLASAEEVTYTNLGSDFTIKDFYIQGTYTSSDGVFNITFGLGTNTNKPEKYDTYIQLNSGNEFTLSMADGKSKITKIVFNYSRRFFDTCDKGEYSNGTWTGSETSVTFKRAGSSTVRLAGMTITYEPAATKQDVTLSMPASASIDVLETFNAAENLTLTVPGGGAADKDAITYSVEPAGDFTFDSETGLFTAGKTEGSYTITATFPEDENYNEAKASTLVTVSSRVWALKHYVPVTGASQIVEGGQYLLVYDDGTSFNVMSTISNFDATNASLPHEYYKDGDLMSVGAEYAGMPIVLEAVGDNFALKTDQGYLKCFENGYGASYGIDTATSTESNVAQWTIEIDTEGKAHIKNGLDSTFELFFDANNNKFLARSASVGYYTPQLYAKCAEMPFNAQALGYGTFAVPYAYKMPAGVKGYAIAGLNESDNTKLVKAEAYIAGQLVPALTPLLVYNENVAGADVNAYPIIVNKEVDASYKGVNNLEFKRNAENKTASMREEAVKYYKLTKNASEDKPLGFYWGAVDGAAFSMTKSSSAYLALPQRLSAAAGLLFDEAGEATGIQLTPAEETAAPAVYNLQGVRVSGKLAKGLYIVNGKKVLVK